MPLGPSGLRDGLGRSGLFDTDGPLRPFLFKLIHYRARRSTKVPALVNQDHYQKP